MSDQFSPGSDFAPMGTAPAPISARTGVAPPPVANAVRLMFIRAALGLLGLIILLATKSALRTAILKRNPGIDSAKVDTLVNSALTVGNFVGLVFIVLYVLLALQVQKGKNWARIVTWVLAGLGVLGALASLAQPQPVLSRILSIVTGIIDAVIIVLLTRRPSNEFFRQPVL